MSRTAGFVLAGCGVLGALALGLGAWARLGDVPLVGGGSASDDATPAIADEPVDDASPATDSGGADRPDTPITAAAPTDAVVGGEHWLGRGTMSSRSIELVWSPVEAATSYRLYRLDGLEGFDVELVRLGPTHLVYDGTGTGHIDDTVERGSFYTYVLEVALVDETLDRRWAQTLALDDTEPPSPITGLTAERTDDGVLLSWEPSDDDVEFSSYSVSLVVDDDTRYLGGGGDLELVMFLDTEPPDGAATYLVEAVDFHDNRGEPATVTVDPAPAASPSSSIGSG